MIVCGGFVALVAAYEPPLSQQYSIERTQRPASKRPLLLLTADGEPFARRGDCVAEPVTLGELPRHLIDAVLAMEDRRFYSHFGIDPQGVVRAAMRNYEAGAIREGGSTITQQLAKIAYLSNERTLDRKLEEALLAVWLETRLMKDQILERYLNSVYFGEGCFGVRAAARHYFDKPVGDISLAESVLLVALLRSPVRLSANFDDALQRAKLVLQAMVREGRLDEARIAAMAPAKFHDQRGNELGPDYADWLAASLHREMEHLRSRQPLRVYTTFEPELQRTAEQALRNVLDKEGKKRNAGQAALVAMRPDGRIVAMVGGRDRASSQFNRAVHARRQPGSAFKIFVYLAALQAGARLDMQVADEPISVAGWEPKNLGERFRGNVSLAQAFASSINTVAVKVSEAVGRDAVIATARDLGIASPLAPNASIALGTSEVSLLEMTAAYAAIAAGAYPVKPWGIAGLEARPSDGGRPPLDAGRWKLRGAEAMRGLLANIVRHGSGRAARLPIAAFGKTGTSQKFRDAWFVGYAGNLVVGVWVGNDDDTPMKRVTGGSLPAQIWRAFMSQAIKTDADFQRKVPQIAAFQARPDEQARHSSRLASLEDIVADAQREEHSGRDEAYFGSGPSLLVREGSSSSYRRSGGASGNMSRDFRRQLNNMGWPGH